MPRRSRHYTDHSKPIEAYRFRIDEPTVGQRIDTLLRVRYPWKSRTHFQSMCRRGEILLNGQCAKPAARVRLGDQVEVRLPEVKNAQGQERGDDLVVLYEDEYLLAIDKPSGMSAHPVGTTRHGTLLNKLHALWRSRYGEVRDPADDRVPRLGHRLDRDTSGVVLCVKDRQVDALVGDMFAERRMSKTYVALVQGAPTETRGRINAPLGDDPFAETTLHQAVLADGLPAQSSWQVREHFGTHTLLELEPHSGRTHQLRVHMAHAGWPIVCDHLYGDVRPLHVSAMDTRIKGDRDACLLSRLGLHASRLSFPHPVTHAPIDLVSPLPSDLAHAVAFMRTMQQRSRCA